MEFEAEPFDLPADITRRIGEIVIAWARVEALIAEFFSFLLRADQGAMYVLNQDLASGTQLKWIRILANYRFTHESTRERLTFLFDRIDRVRAERNVYIHGVWGPGPVHGSAIVQTVKLDRAEWIRTELVTGADLEDIFIEIKAVSAELYMVGKTLGFIP
jgi:hypothetical protein